MTHELEPRVTTLEAQGRQHSDALKMVINKVDYVSQGINELLARKAVNPEPPKLRERLAAFAKLLDIISTLAAFVWATVDVTTASKFGTVRRTIGDLSATVQPNTTWRQVWQKDGRLYLLDKDARRLADPKSWPARIKTGS